MKPALFALAALCTIATTARAQAPAEAEEVLSITRNPTNGAISLSWEARGDRTYFLQHNPSLVSPSNPAVQIPWIYVPDPSLIRSFFSPQNTAMVFPPSAAAGSFFRLRVAMMASEDPINDDFDGDGISNGEEISTHGIDPLSGDTDGDGATDGDEVNQGTDPKSAGSHPAVWRGVTRTLQYDFDDYPPPNKRGWLTRTAEWDSSLNSTEELTSAIPFPSLRSRLDELTFPESPPPRGGSTDLLLSWGFSQLLPNPPCYHATLNHHRFWLSRAPAEATAFSQCIVLVTQRTIDGTDEPIVLSTQTVTIPANDTTSSPIDLRETLQNNWEDDQLHTEYFDQSILPVEMKEVSFGGTKYHELKSDDAATTYAAPHWVDSNGDRDAADVPHGEHNYAVAYTRNTKPEIGARLKIGDLPSGISIQIRATGPGDVQIPATTPTVSGDEIHLALTESTGALVNTIKHYTHKDSALAFELRWELSVDGGSNWSEVAKTKHTVYVTLDDPAPMLDFNGNSVTLRQESLFELGCRNADGETAQASATAKIWSEFADRVVKRVDGTQMTYYKSFRCTNVEAAELLKEGDGQCGSWAELFIRIRQIQGINEAQEYVIFRPVSADGFIVKNWNFVGAGSSGASAFPYLNIPPVSGDPRDENSYTWRYSEVNDADGIPGQGTPNPASLFNNHQVVIGGEYYDPSYGLKHANLQAIDDNAIDGFYSGPEFRQVSEATVGLDLNGDGNLNGIVNTVVILFKKNPAGLDLVQERRNY